jgi:hypothetical protein
LLNLAVCHEETGRTATAWLEFTDALRIATRDGRTDREALAKEHLSALAPRLARVRIIVTAPRAPMLDVSCDGVRVGEAAWGEAIPLDLGEHVVEARAPGYRPIRSAVRAVEGEETSVTLTPLEPEPEAPGPRPADKARARADRRTVGVLLGGAGLATAALGGAFGLHAIALDRQAGRLCPTARDCQPDGETLNGRAKTAADLSTALFAAGAVLTTASLVVFLWPPTAGQGHPVVQARIDATTAGAVVRQTW